MRILILFTTFVATVFGANWAIEHYGFVSVAPGVQAPAGVFFAGIAFTVRDLLHEQKRGVIWVPAAILAGAACSLLISPVFATASAAAFLFSELADFAVYHPLRQKGWLPAVAVSNAVGLAVDSALFLWLAFGSLDFIEGQILGKAYMTALAIPLVWLLRKRSVA
ncbi:MAG: VUT family protein [Dehalococcoidia bacterium]|nr:VUT family protein [Dehalococcoidia bacterium]